VTFGELFVAATGKTPYPWQRALAERREPARVIDAPTGTGKTEAVLLDWLWRRFFHPDCAERRRTPRRLVYALPMRVLVEQTLKRVDHVLQRLFEIQRMQRRIRVYPIMGGMADDSWVLEPETEAVLVGTIDMLVSRALNRGFGRGRALWPVDFGLLNNDCLWVFDEIQLMDAAVATSCQLEALRKRFGVVGPTRTVWMSATLDLSWLETRDHSAPKEEDVARLTQDDSCGDLGKRLTAPKQLVRKELDPSRTAELARLVCEEHNRLRNIPDAPRLTVAITNTVERAIDLYKEIKRLVPRDVPLLIHSRFRPADRERLVNRLEERLPPDGRIVVSTQVIEAGIDLDAGALITELAPWASMVQRAGRLNRSGSRTSSPARLVWIDPGTERLERLRHPYELEALRHAREQLQTLNDAPFSPNGITALMKDDPARQSRLLGRRPTTLLLRAPDLLDLFDTDPTLDGDDPDVGRFIRSGEDLDVGVAWRHFPENEPPSKFEPVPTRSEVCPVPVWDKRKLVALAPWRWSYSRRRWEQVLNEDDLVPGDVVIVRSDTGGYDPELGWTGKKQGRVDPVLGIAPGKAADTDTDDRESLGCWVTLQEHTRDVLRELKTILGRITLDAEWARALELAALAHDTGKAHHEFQRRLKIWAREDPPDTAVFAKSPERVPWRPPFVFRHELVSALLLLERGKRSRELDLPAYLVAAHHGKLRLTPRLLPDDQNADTFTCLGVRHKDKVPEIILEKDPELILEEQRFGPIEVDLSLMRIGDLNETTWVERALDLRDQLGVFRLAYLEALLRAADQRASEKEREQARRSGGVAHE